MTTASSTPGSTPDDPYGCGGGISFSNRFIASVPANGISGNTISGNRVGAVYHGPNATQVRDLRDNDWGDASGPYHAVRNPTGTGNAVIDQSSDPANPNPGMVLDPWIATGYTPAGAGVDVEITAALPGGSTAAISVGFDQVLTAGVTSVTASEATPPDGFRLGDPPVQYEVATTAAFSGSVELCFTWTEGQFFNEQAIRLYHFESSAWVDVTTAVDTTGNVACGSVTSLSPFALMEVSAYSFAGFFPPVGNLPAVNVVKAGQAVPVKFSLGGDRGLDIFAAGYPVSQVVTCTGGPGVGGVIATVTAGTSALQYDSTNEQYTYVWKTDRAWANTCRLLILGFNDGSRPNGATARFQFR